MSGWRGRGRTAGYLGTFASFAALTTAIPSARDGDFAGVDAGAGSDIVVYKWDLDDAKWVATGGMPVAADKTVLANISGAPGQLVPVPIASLPVMHATGAESVAGLKVFSNGLQISTGMPLWTGSFTQLSESSGALYISDTMHSTTVIRISNNSSSSCEVQNNGSNLMLLSGAITGYLGTTSLGGMMQWSANGLIPLYSGFGLGDLFTQWGYSVVRRPVTTEWEGNASFQSVDPGDGSTVAIGHSFTRIANGALIANVTFDFSALDGVVGVHGMDGVPFSIIFLEGAAVTNLHWPAGIAGAALLPATSTGAYMKIDFRRFGGSVYVDGITK